MAGERIGMLIVLAGRRGGSVGRSEQGAGSSAVRVGRGAGGGSSCAELLDPGCHASTALCGDPFLCGGLKDSSSLRGKGCGRGQAGKR